MLTHQANTLTIGNGNIYYERRGQGTTLILGHAGFVDSGMWDQQFNVLSQHYDVVRYDMRGYGRSSAPTQAMSRRHELGEIMQALDIDQAILMGCSLSGTTMMDFTLENPEKVIALITVSATPSGFELQGEPPRYLFEMFGALQAGNLQHASELQARIWFDGDKREPDDVDATLREQVKAMNLISLEKQAFFIADSQPLSPLDPPAIDRLAEIQIPTLAIVGAQDHPEIERAATFMQDIMPNATKHVIDGGAHVVNMEQSTIFNRVVSDFLSSL